MNATKTKKTFPTRIDLAAEVRGPMIALLNQQLAGTSTSTARRSRPTGTSKAPSSTPSTNCSTGWPRSWRARWT